MSLDAAAFEWRRVSETRHSVGRAAGAVKALPIALAAALLGAGSPAIRLQVVASTSQPGVVGYRDPLGAVSPDGTLLAFTSGRHLRLRRLEGGPVSELGPADRNLTHIAWLPDSRRLASYGRNPDTDEAGWILHDVMAGSREPLWPHRLGTSRQRQLAWSHDGTSVGVALRDAATDLVRLGVDGSVKESAPSPLRLSFPAPSPDGRTVACLALVDGRPRLSLPCGAAPGAEAPEAYGPMAFSPDGAHLYYSTPNDAGTLDLWSRSLGDGRAERLTSFTRDAYAPSVTRAGDVLFKLQEYAVHVATVPSAGGAVTPLASFQSETPSWHPDGRQIGITYGTWRRMVDDFRYPDIAQDLGILSLDRPRPASAPARVVSATSSEDQGLCWSPNGRFIALHSHLGPADDVFLMPADLSRPPRQISTGGSETGWPRWSPDGRFIAFTTDVAVSAHGIPSWERPRERNAILLIGIDQVTGEVKEAQRQVVLSEFEGQPLHVEWAPDSERLFFDSNDGGDRRSLNVVPRGGGHVTRLHRFDSEQAFSGIGVSPDGRSLSFVAPARDGFYQIFVVPSTGGTAVQVTSPDPQDPAVILAGRTDDRPHGLALRDPAPGPEAALKLVHPAARGRAPVVEAEPTLMADPFAIARPTAPASTS